MIVAVSSSSAYVFGVVSSGERCEPRALRRMARRSCDEASARAPAPNRGRFARMALIHDLATFSLAAAFATDQDDAALLDVDAAATTRSV